MPNLTASWRFNGVSQTIKTPKFAEPPNLDMKNCPWGQYCLIDIHFHTKIDKILMTTETLRFTHCSPPQVTHNRHSLPTQLLIQNEEYKSQPWHQTQT